MRIIKIPFLVEATRKHPKARKWIENWSSIAKEVQWKNIQEVRASYPSADTVAVDSGRKVVAFNVCGNDFRLIAAIHYNRGIICTLLFFDSRRIQQGQMEKRIMKTKLAFKEMPKDYRGLLALHMLRPIHDKVDYGNALEILDAMAGQSLKPDQDDYFEALSVLVEAYETSHLPGLPNKRGLPLLKHLIEENSMSAADLSRLLDADRSLGVRILNGERNLTVDHIKKLASRFQIPLGLLIG